MVNFVRLIDTLIMTDRPSQKNFLQHPQSTCETSITAAKTPMPIRAD
jgi:hypothetical protein